MAAIRRSASFVLVPEQSAVKYSKYAASRDAESASASPGVNSKTFRSFTRMFATSPFGAPQQSSYFFPVELKNGGESGIRIRQKTEFKRVAGNDEESKAPEGIDRSY
jgi:hypothetical protein